MKVIDVSTEFALIEDVDSPTVSYRMLCEEALNIPPTDHEGRPIGFSVSVMDQRLPVIAKIKNEKGSKVELEDAEMDVLVACVDQLKFRILHQGFIDFVSAIHAAQKEESAKARKI